MRTIIIAEPISAGDVLSWPITSKLDGVLTSGSAILVPHSKAGQWPVSNIDGTLVEGNLWAIVQDGDRWVAGTVEWLRPGQVSKDVDPASYGPRFKSGYDHLQAKPGDLVGIFVSTPARLGKRSPVNERSNIVWIRVGQLGVVEVEGGTVEPPAPPEPPQPEPPAVKRDYAEQLDAILAELVRQRGAVEAAVAELRTLRDVVRPALTGGIKIRF